LNGNLVSSSSLSIDGPLSGSGSISANSGLSISTNSTISINIVISNLLTIISGYNPTFTKSMVFNADNGFTQNSMAVTFNGPLLINPSKIITFSGKLLGSGTISINGTLMVQTDTINNPINNYGSLIINYNTNFNGAVYLFGTYVDNSFIVKYNSNLYISSPKNTTFSGDLFGSGLIVVNSNLNISRPITILNPINLCSYLFTTSSFKMNGTLTINSTGTLTNNYIMYSSSDIFVNGEFLAFSSVIGSSNIVVSTNGTLLIYNSITISNNIINNGVVKIYSSSNFGLVTNTGVFQLNTNGCPCNYNSLKNTCIFLQGNSIQCPSQICSTNCVHLNNGSCILNTTDCIPYSCYSINATSSNVCNGNGVCISSNNCQCNQNYTGSNCSIPLCYGKPANDSNVCGGNGVCESPNNCNCNANYNGPTCKITSCYLISSDTTFVCSGRGECSSYDNCECRNHYYGKDCSVTTCNETFSNSSTVCNSQGNCTDFEKCTCFNNATYVGTICQYPICYELNSTNPKVCDGNGACISYNKCECNQPYFGEQCKINRNLLWLIFVPVIGVVSLSTLVFLLVVVVVIVVIVIIVVMIIVKSNMAKSNLIYYDVEELKDIGF
jgi:hypothetical protein